MLDLGFIIPIRQIISRMPKERQSLFFSATMPKEIAGLAADFLRDPRRSQSRAGGGRPLIAWRRRSISSTLRQSAACLSNCWRSRHFSATIVFARTKHGADKVTQHLEVAGIPSAAIHGNKSQGQRQRALDAFRAGRTKVLVATDIAARGIDVDGVTHVVNFELPDVPETYVHRIGRTARAGAEGIAVSLCDDSEKHLLRAIERLTRQTLSVTDRRTPGASRAEPADRQRQRAEFATSRNVIRSAPTIVALRRQETRTTRAPDEAASLPRSPAPRRWPAGELNVANIIAKHKKSSPEFLDCFFRNDGAAVKARRGIAWDQPASRPCGLQNEAAATWRYRSRPTWR